MPAQRIPLPTASACRDFTNPHVPGLLRDKTVTVLDESGNFVTVTNPLASFHYPVSGWRDFEEPSVLPWCSTQRNITPDQADTANVWSRHPADCPICFAVCVKPPAEEPLQRPLSHRRMHQY
jgi:hypothetical protein